MSKIGVIFEVRQHHKFPWVWEIWDVEHPSSGNHFPILSVDSKGASDDFHEKYARVCCDALNNAFAAQAIEARQGEDAKTGFIRKDESAVHEVDAPNLNPDTSDRLGEG